MPGERGPNPEERIHELEREIQQLRNSHSQVSDAIIVMNRAQRLHDDSITDHKYWLGELSKAQARNEERWRGTDERYRETDERFRETDGRFRQSREEEAERGRVLDKRIADLVSGIGEFMRQK